MTDDRRKWHLKKELSLGDMLTLGIVIISLLGAYFSVDKRVAILEVYAATATDQRWR